MIYKLDYPEEYQMYRKDIEKVLESSPEALTVSEIYERVGGFWSEIDERFLQIISDLRYWKSGYSDKIKLVKGTKHPCDSSETGWAWANDDNYCSGIPCPAPMASSEIVPELADVGEEDWDECICYYH